MRVGNPVLEAAEVVARPGVGGVCNHAFLLELRVAGEIGRLAFAQISEDQPQILPHRVAANPDAGAEGLWLGWLLGALAPAILLPPVVEAPDLVALDPPGTELGAPMCTSECNEVSATGLSSIQGQILT